MFKSNRVHYFVECFQKISSSAFSGEAYNDYQDICKLHSITSIFSTHNCRALHCTAFVSLLWSRYGLNNVERDVKHQIIIISSSSISLKTTTYIRTHFSYFNAYSVLFNKIKLRFFILTLQIYVFVRARYWFYRTKVTVTYGKISDISNIRAASRLTDSRRSDWALVQLSQIILAYSRMGLMYVTWILVSDFLSRSYFNNLIKYTL